MRQKDSTVASYTHSEYQFEAIDVLGVIAYLYNLFRQNYTLDRWQAN